MNLILPSPLFLSHALPRAIAAWRLAPARPRPATLGPVALALAADAIRELPQPQRQRIVCVSGVLWITQDWQCQDIVLMPGQSYTVPGRHRLLIQALESARLQIHAA
ncbi:MAG: DUF2917 domain-containing protein [Burkholderiaceae bacterium]|nr:DUF2917 domain-containing protein [Burkholderiaceae bacterium]